MYDILLCTIRRIWLFSLGVNLLSKRYAVAVTESCNINAFIRMHTLCVMSVNY